MVKKKVKASSKAKIIRITAMILVGMMTLSTALSAIALTANAATKDEDDLEKIGKVYLDIESNISSTNPEDVIVNNTGEHYKIEEVEVLNIPDPVDTGNNDSDNDKEETWQTGDEPKIAIYLVADEGYYFNSQSKSNIKFTGDAGQFIQATREDDDQYMQIICTLIPVGGGVGKVQVNSMNISDYGMLTWQSSYKATHYKFTLSRNYSAILKDVDTKETSYDARSYFTEPGNYQFKIQAIGPSNKTSNEVTSAEFVITQRMVDNIKIALETEKATGITKVVEGKDGGPGTDGFVSGWLRDEVGWYYKNTDGSYLTNGWVQISNKWYFFDGVGYAKTGWVLTGDKWYYLDNTHCYMITGWLDYNGAWYYLDDTNGNMLVNSTTPDGFSVGADGVWVK